MKTFFVIGAVALAVVSGQAAAVCSGNTRLNATQLGTALAGNTVCVANSSGGWEWQEFHSGTSGGNLIDWKLGADPRDPTETVGNWYIDGTGNSATVRHAYLGGGGSYSYSVYKNGTGATATYSFCGTATVEAKIKQNQGSCSTLSTIP